MHSDSLQFLNGGGEMGAHMQALDWTTTPLGPPAHWPQSLKTIVRVMLDSRFAPPAHRRLSASSWSTTTPACART